MQGDKRLSISLQKRNKERNGRNELEIWERSKKKYAKMNGDKYDKKDVVIEALRVYNNKELGEIAVINFGNELERIFQKIKKIEEIQNREFGEKTPLERLHEFLTEGENNSE